MDWKAFFGGWASAFGTWGGSHIEIPDPSTGPQRDAAALAEDWRRVGEDIRWAMDKIDEELAAHE